MVRGKFISIEGIEGAGKSTALTYIKNYLDASHIDVVWTREPGGTELAEEIRSVTLHPKSSEKMVDETELLLMFAARAQHLHHLIIPALTQNKWVVSDRFVDATYAYQSGGRKIQTLHVEWLDKWIVANHYPDLTILLDISPELGFERTEQRGLQKDRIEKEKIEFFKGVREVYLSRAMKEPNRIKIIDASKTLAEVQEQIRSLLDDFISRNRA